MNVTIYLTLLCVFHSLVNIPKKEDLQHQEAFFRRGDIREKREREKVFEYFFGLFQMEERDKMFFDDGGQWYGKKAKEYGKNYWKGGDEKNRGNSKFRFRGKPFGEELLEELGEEVTIFWKEGKADWMKKRRKKKRN